ncbi:NmrA family NAD(P)-binding protein [Nonomuraea sp. SYSU D8015]|uniref:NmrA family NAD(P)-binding protein n=1 Tax=Nonomuraea sp. SYSU D8015 TaxID=2593644 RepID=UPI0016613832|nr:NmrA family NAD(P)-binding protein [Nonomuraea sp. SYSU D8015]
MADKKVIAVVGATGAQGGGLARAILADAGGAFAVRALTRNPSSDKARKLAAQGAVVVEADIRDEARLTEAFDGAHGAFLVTDFWEHMSPEQEKQDAATMARAAKNAGLRHVIWSTLDDTRAHRAQDGRLVLALPMADGKLAGIAAEDIGKTAYGIFKRGDELVGHSVSIAGEHLTGAQMAAHLSKALGEQVTYVPVPFDAMRAQPFPAAAEIGNMFQFYAQVPQFVADRDLDVVRGLNPQLQDFEQWLAAHKTDLAGI